MRSIRALTVAAVVMAALPTIAHAQGGRGFKDSWFWGLKGGGYSLADSGQNYVQAPTVGVEWLITRTHGGLYVSGAQTFFSQHSFTLRKKPEFASSRSFTEISVSSFPMPTAWRICIPDLEPAIATAISNPASKL